MAGRNYRLEQIINKVREAEILPSQGSSPDKATRKIELTKRTVTLMARIRQDENWRGYKIKKT